ncbi:MAG: GTP-binding protein, partial [Planctomycetota bacterium]
MVQINFAKREVQCKIVYYGPPESGKTANLRALHARLPASVRGTLTSIQTDAQRTLFFDFLPLDLGRVADARTKVHLYAVPYLGGQNALRLLVLEGADGIVFVADSSPGKEALNCGALANLRENLAESGREFGEIPVVYQWNKRDVADAIPEDELRAGLGAERALAVPASTATGEGVVATLKAITHAVLVQLCQMARLAPVLPPPAAAPKETLMPEPQLSETRQEAMHSNEDITSEIPELSSPRPEAAKAPTPEPEEERRPPAVPRWRSAPEPLPETLPEPETPAEPEKAPVVPASAFFEEEAAGAAQADPEPREPPARPAPPAAP